MNVKLIALVGLAVVAGSAQAITFNFRSTGIAVRAGSTFNVNDNSLTGYIAPSPLPAYSFVSLNYVPTTTFVGASLAGTVTGSGTLTILDTVAAANKTLNFTFAGAASRVSGTSLDNVSFANVGFAIAGSNFVGTGIFSSNLTAFTPNSVDYRSQTTFYSTFNAVPEPASMAALAIGAAGLLRRRRKA